MSLGAQSEIGTKETALKPLQEKLQNEREVIQNFLKVISRVCFFKYNFLLILFFFFENK